MPFMPSLLRGPNSVSAYRQIKATSPGLARKITLLQVCDKITTPRFSLAGKFFGRRLFAGDGGPFACGCWAQAFTAVTTLPAGKAPPPSSYVRAAGFAVTVRKKLLTSAGTNCAMSELWHLRACDCPPCMRYRSQPAALVRGGREPGPGAAAHPTARFDAVGRRS